VVYGAQSGWEEDESRALSSLLWTFSIELNLLQHQQTTRNKCRRALFEPAALFHNQLTQNSGIHFFNQTL